METVNATSDHKSVYEIKRFDGMTINLWKIRMCNILFLKERDHALGSMNPTTLTDLTWSNFNKKATTYIQRAVKHEILLNLIDYNTTSEVWEKLRVAMKTPTPCTINQMRFMGKLVSIQLDESKSTNEHKPTFTSLLNQFQGK